MAITAGIDAGAKNTKVVILSDGEVQGRGTALTGFDQAAAVEEALAAALAQAGLERDALERVVATGGGRENVPPAHDRVEDATAGTRAAVHLVPETRTVVDVGAEEARGISTDETGAVVDVAHNEACAAGTGAFTEAMGRALGLATEAIGAVSLASTQKIEMNAQCTVFAESELVKLIHANTPVADIARAVHDAIAARTASMVERVGLKPTVMLVGGVAKNVGFRASLEAGLGRAVVVPAHPEYVGALGAALVAAEQVGS